MVHGPCQRQHARAAHAAIGRLDPGEPAERRRDANRATRVRAERAGTDARRYRCARSGRRAAADAVNRGVPRIPRRPVMRIETFGPIGELVHIELAQGDGAGAREPRDDSGILVGHPVGEKPGAARGLHAFGAVEILESHGHPVQRSERGARLHGGLRGTGRGQRGVAHHGDVRPELAVESRDAVEMRLDDLHGRDLLRGDHARQLRHGCPAELIHG